MTAHRLVVHCPSRSPFPLADRATLRLSVAAQQVEHGGRTVADDRVHPQTRAEAHVLLVVDRPHPDVVVRFVALLHVLGAFADHDVWVWTVDDEEDMRLCTRLG